MGVSTTTSKDYQEKPKEPQVIKHEMRQSSLVGSNEARAKVNSKKNRILTCQNE
ncbi:MAG: hypothetical protein ACI9A7_001113 [Cyclobacteriaceae bacterium]|jgi:hypothetical protein